MEEGEHPIVTSLEQRDATDRDWFEYLADQGTKISLELYRLLKSRRYESREGPFLGFESPPEHF